MLRECRRVVAEGGAMAFTVIELAPGLSPSERERAAAATPPETETPAPYPDLLARSGWELVERTDVTGAFLRLSRRDLAAWEARRERLARALGADDVRGRIGLRRARVAALEAGLIRREVMAARPLGASPARPGRPGLAGRGPD